jgi:hypothetical protein
MAITKTYDSPDGRLRFQVIREDDGDTRLEFEGFPWHTHGDLLVGSYGPTQEAAIDRFVADLLQGRSTIALYRRDGVLYDICITDDRQSDLGMHPQTKASSFGSGMARPFDDGLRPR